MVTDIFDIAGSIIPHSPPNGNASLHALNGHVSPLAANVTNADDLPARSPSEFSYTEDAPGEVLSDEEQAHSFANNVAVATADMSESSGDEDAEGSDDADYDIESPVDAPSPTPSSNNSTVEPSGRIGKRKASVDDDDHILQNPELYGLRRSVIVPSSFSHGAIADYLIGASPTNSSRGEYP